MDKKNRLFGGSESKASPDSLKRRKLLGAIAVGGAAYNLVPTKWSKPIVDSVMLPAHAQLSPVALSTYSCTATGYLVFPTYSISGLLTNTTNSSWSGNWSASTAEFTYAVVSGTVSAVATYTGSARGFYTVPAITTGTEQFVPFIFDTTCAG